MFGLNDAGSAGDVLEDDPVGRLKVYVYELPSKYNKKLLQKDPRCLTHMFAAEIFMHRFLLSSPVRTLNPKEADWFYTPIYITCDLTPTGLPLPFKSPRMMRSAIQLISSKWPYWNRTEGADHFFVVPHDFGACFHYQVRTFISLILKTIALVGLDTRMLCMLGILFRCIIDMEDRYVWFSWSSEKL